MNKSKKLGAILSVILLFAAFFSKNAIAQNPQSYYLETPRTFSGGLVAGTSFCQVDGDKFAGYFKVGITAGAIVYTHINEHARLSLELLFIQKGSNANIAQLSSSKTYNVLEQKINLSYAEIPVMFHLFDKRKSHVGLGLSYARLINGDEILKTSPANTYDPSKYPFKKNDVNILAGVNLSLTKNLYANLRFQYSLLPVRSNVDYEFARSKQYNNLWVLRLMYLF